MSNIDSTHTLDPEESAEMLDMFNDMSFHSEDAKMTNGFTRQRSISKLKAPPRRDSQTLPWRSNSIRASRSMPASDAGDKSSTAAPKRPDSPDIETILASTPRPRKSSSASLLTTPSRTKPSASFGKSSKSDAGSLVDDKSFSSVSSDFGTLLEDDSDPEDGDGSETDSSIDIHTPLPHLMFRDGLLSPRSKLLPQSSPYSESGGEPQQRAGSVMSLASTVGSTTTKQRPQRDPRDTERRRLRHRDGSLLKAGMGLTTGLGWSDSEDEDAPSLLTRRLINSTIEQRKRSGSVTSSMSSPSRVASPTSSISMSRIASPVPSAKSVLSRKAISNSNLRSASVSFPTRQASTPLSGPGTGMRIPRGRSVSTATHMSSLGSASSTILSSRSIPASSVSKTGVSLPRATTKEEEPHSPPSPVKTPTASMPPRLSRTRTDSTASSGTTHSLASTTSTQVSSSAQSKATTGHLNSIQMPRPRTDSSASASASTASLVSTYSQYSQVSSSTASSSSVVPRPLRLPQRAGLKMPLRSFSQDITFPSVVPPPVKEKASELKWQRLRTLSNPQSETVAPMASIQQSLAMSRPVGSGVLPPGSPPMLRQRQTPNGARPRPRTGTGMIYRTSSYSGYTSFHESVARIRETSAVPSSDGAFHAL